MVRFLSKEEIVLINKLTIREHGGRFVPPFNFLHEHAIDYLLEAVTSEMFGQVLYPELYQKAGVYLFNIISDHPFQDGNKRTGLQAAHLFLKLNGLRFSPLLDHDQIIQFVLDIASGKYSVEEVQLWLKDKLVKL